MNVYTQTSVYTYTPQAYTQADTRKAKKEEEGQSGGGIRGSG